jgi:hypothetical protein
MNFRTVVLAFSLALMLAVGAFGQTTLPNNFGGGGLGFQAMSTPQMSGWLEIDKALPDVTIGGFAFHSYAGVATDYFGNSTAARVDTKIVFLHHTWFTAGSLQGAGAAMSANGLGGSFALGPWATASMAKLLNIPGAVAAFSATWQKDDISVMQQEANLPEKLKKLGARGTYRFGFGKTW